MKRLLLLVLIMNGVLMQAQDNSALIKHYETYTKQMKTQGDVQGIISGLTHLNILKPSEARKDTLAYIYMSEGKEAQALNTIGIELKVDDSDIALQVKAVCLKSVGQPEKALVHFEEMFRRNPNASVAYELAELNMQIQKFTEAKKHVDYGLANSTDDMVKGFYETQAPYQVPLKAAFLYLDGLITFNANKTANVDAAVDILDEALKLAPNFNMAQVGKNALLQQKQALAQDATETKD
jgi:tetratricopeptide (TPR) repeat protein